MQSSPETELHIHPNITTPKHEEREVHLLSQVPKSWANDLAERRVGQNGGMQKGLWEDGLSWDGERCEGEEDEKHSSLSSQKHPPFLYFHTLLLHTTTHTIKP